MKKSLFWNVSCVVLCMLVFASCAPRKDLSKDYLYFQDADSIKRVMTKYAEYKIRTDDILSIGISTPSVTQEQLIPFEAVIKNDMKQETSIRALPNYTVDAEGNIQLPLIGKVKVSGLTRKQAQLALEEKLANFIAKPTVSVAVMNFSVTVLGEVKQPGRYTMPHTNASLVDAIAAARDLTPFADRKQLLLMRENSVGEMEFKRLDLTSVNNFINNESFQLAQNDVLYVPTNKLKIEEATTDPMRKFTVLSLIFQGITTITVLATLIVSLN